MKKIFTLIALMMVTVMGAKAQDMTDNYSRIYAGFNALAFEHAPENHYGFGVGYAYGANITGHNLPMFIELGGEYAYVSSDKLNEKFHSLAVPVNFTYKFGNEKFAVAPFIGETFRVGLSYDAPVLAVVTEKTSSIYDDPVNAHRFTAHFSFGCNFTIAQHYNIGWRTMIAESYIGNDTDYSSLFSVGYVF